MRKSWTTSGTALHLALPPAGPRRDALEIALRAAIRDGRLAAGSRLPSTRALAVDLGIARGTVVEAYAQLIAEGYLDARRGAGTWVAALGLAGVPAAPRARPAARPPRFDYHPGQPDLSAFPRAAWAAALRRGFRTAADSTLGYGDPRGRPELREELALYLMRARGAVADPEHVVLCCGFRHGLSLVSRALRAQGGAKRIAIEDPCAPPHRAAAAAAGADLVPLPVDSDGARTDLLHDLKVDAAVIGPAHQYPLGVVLQAARRAAAVDWARATGGVIVEDDYDAELRYDRQPIGALQALAPDHVAYGGTASKTLVPGLRLGWLLLPARLLEPVLAIRAVEDVHVPATDQIAFAELLRSGAFERHVRRMRARYGARRERLLSILAGRAPAVRPAGAAAGLSVLLDLPDHGPDAAELCARAAERSMRLYGPAGRNAVLVGFGALSEHDAEAGLRALGNLLAESYRRRSK
jgi:GntR family transcriptional regulator/MocR family aminotransferase